MTDAATLPPAMDEDTLNQLIDVVRKFVNERLIPLEAQVAEEDKIPEDVVQEMRDMGLFGLTIPQQYGGIGTEYLRRMPSGHGVRTNLPSLPLHYRYQ
jgi:alkylation response protein AidB-like acyl-CoA dehydrogenase